MSAADGSSAPTLTVNGTPTVANSEPVTTDLGAVLLTMIVLIDVCWTDPEVTRSAIW
jgi:hypothetical protein